MSQRSYLKAQLFDDGNDREDMADEKSLMTTIMTTGKTTERDRFQVMLN